MPGFLDDYTRAGNPSKSTATTIRADFAAMNVALKLRTNGKSTAADVRREMATYEFERGDVVSATLLGAYVMQQRPVLTATERAPLNLQRGIDWDCASSVSRNIARDMMLHVESESEESLLYLRHV